MSLPIRQIEIKNFKSIKETHLEQRKRINLFIGKPNVGKSNLLEALSLFSFPFLKYLKRKDIRQFIRVENMSELFYDGDINQPIHIKADPYRAAVTWSPQNTLSVELRFPHEEEIKSIREKENGEIFLIPFSGLADTLQRIIFYKAAIQSNRNSVLLFEEPEAHAYPPYITGIVQDIIHSTENQFFLTTHSPYVVNALLENPTNDLSIYVVDMKDGCTVVKRLTDDDLQNVYEYGVDLFFKSPLQIHYG